ncbi:MAG: ABC transporter ATP-binding protein [Bacilli bacterium]|nr:ABC transporter ATP-binding protein [Bacilli bacterium]MDD4795013.1 ABC transporter ATP-binding protein [Bacilli bacterium]
MSKSIIKIKNLTKDYGNNKGVFDISFEIPKGEVFGFLGPNGAGKTTTIRHLMGFIKPDYGECYINNCDCFTSSDKIQETLGYIPGEGAFINDMTGTEFIDFMAKYRGLKNLNKADELIKRFELDSNTKIKKMSKGMKQKLGIIVAFMHDPDILILDEPTSGLDPLMQNIFIKMINEEKKKGKTILISSHIFEEIERTADKVAIIKNGRIVAINSIKNLKKNQSRKFTITFNNQKDIENIQKAKIEITDIIDNKVTFLIRNNIKEFIKILNKYDIIDIDEEKQSLEDIFMNFYGGENND